MAKTLHRLTAAQTIQLADWVAGQAAETLAGMRPLAVAQEAGRQLGFAISPHTVEWVAKQRGIPLKRLRRPAEKINVSAAIREMAKALVETIRAINATPDDFLLRLAGMAPRPAPAASTAPAGAAVLPRFNEAAGAVTPGVHLPVPACTAVPVTAETAGGMERGETA